MRGLDNIGKIYERFFGFFFFTSGLSLFVACVALLARSEKGARE
jgi:hypothetical protein